MRSATSMSRATGGKFTATARYLRGDSEGLRLEEVFDCTGTYGSMIV